MAALPHTILVWVNNGCHCWLMCKSLAVHREHLI